MVIVGISAHAPTKRLLFSPTGVEETNVRQVVNINPYLVPGPNIIVKKAMKPLNALAPMDFGNKADDGGHLTLSPSALDQMALDTTARKGFIRRFYGSKEFINGEVRYCIWITDEQLPVAMSQPALARQIDLVRKARLKSRNAYARSLASRPHQFKTPRAATSAAIITPRVSSENRPYLPVGLVEDEAIIGDRNFALYGVPLWHLAIIASRLHWVWIATVCVRMRTNFSYSNTLGWNTFPVPTLTDKNKADLTRCAEDILLAREAHFPATIANLYDPDAMPRDLRDAHERNDEVLERILVGRRFNNDTERLEKLFELYSKLTAAQEARGEALPKRRRKRPAATVGAPATPGQDSSTTEA